MNGTTLMPIHTRRVLLHLILWCSGICSLWAQAPESVQRVLPDSLSAVISEATPQEGNGANTPAALSSDATQTVTTVPQDSSQTLTQDEDLEAYQRLKASLDTTQAVTLADSVIRTAVIPQEKKAFVPDPIRSMWLALVFPGAGQIYNNKYWKLPIVYGGFLGCAYALTWNGQMLRDYSQAYLDIMDDNPDTKSYEKMLPMGYNIEGKEERFKEIFKNKKNYFRKYRDMSIFAFAGVYLISVIDAYVDAELSSFDISRDLSLRLEPTVIETPRNLTCYRGPAALGVQCLLNF